MTVRVLVCGRNVEPWIRRCLASVYAQDHDDFTVTVVDDASTDGTREIVLDTIKFGWTVILNDERVGATGNIWNNTRNMADDDILVLLDADDWFACNDALSHIAGVYAADPDCWLTYGDYRSEPHDPTCPSVEDYPRDVIRERSFRTHSNVFNHPLTFLGGMFNHIHEDDLRLANGEWVPGVYDEAIMYAAAELCGPHMRRLDRVLYTYNSANSASCVHTQADEIRAAGAELRARPKRARLYRSDDGLIEHDDTRQVTIDGIMSEYDLKWLVDLGTRSGTDWTWFGGTRTVMTFYADGECYYRAIGESAGGCGWSPVFGDPIEVFPWVSPLIPAALWWVDGEDPRIMDLLFQVIGRGMGDVVAVDDAWLAPVDEIRGQVTQLCEAFGVEYDVTVEWDVVRVVPS